MWTRRRCDLKSPEEFPGQLIWGETPVQELHFNSQVKHIDTGCSSPNRYRRLHQRRVIAFGRHPTPRLSVRHPLDAP